MTEIPPRHTPLFAVVEIGSEAGVLAFAAFVITFVVVCAAYWLLRGGRPGAQAAKPWHFNTTRQLHVGKSTFDHVAHLTRKAVARPAITPETREFVDNLGHVRNTLASFNRIALIVIGAGGIIASIALLRQANAANMLLLPGAIILLLSLGALINGLIPSRTTALLEPQDPELFENVHVHVSTQPLTIALSRFDLMKASEMRRNGSSDDDVARSIYPGYDALNDFEKSAVRQALANAPEG